MTILILTVLTMTVLITSNMGDIKYNDFTYKQLYLYIVNDVDATKSNS